jgi:hypothetical protein
MATCFGVFIYAIIRTADIEFNFKLHCAKWDPMQYYTECLQKNDAVSNIDKKFISHLIRAKRTPSTVATVQVFMH